jgi:hypothetical protein
MPKRRGQVDNASAYPGGPEFKSQPKIPDIMSIDVELRLFPRWLRGNIGSTDATKTCYILNAFIFETNNCKVINNTSLDRL